MKILKVATETLVHKMDDTELDRFFAESISNISLIKKLEDALYMVDESYEGERKDEILDAMESLAMQGQAVYLDVFTQGMCAPNSTLKRRADNAISYMKRLLEPCRKLVSVWLSPDSAQERDLLKLSVAALAELSHLIYYQFLMNLTWNTRFAGQDMEISSVLERYSSAKRINPVDVVTSLREVMVSHRPPLSFAEVFPDDMEEIYDKLGPYVIDLEEVDELIDEKLIKALLANEITPEFIIQFLEEKRGGK